MPKCFSIIGFCHLYRSLLRFLSISPFEAKALVFLLNTANIDTCSATHRGRMYREKSESEFFKCLDRNVRSYHTEVQLYKSMQALDDNIRWDHITEAQRQAVIRLRILTKTLTQRFKLVFGCEVDDDDTVFEDCSYDLAPDENEPMTSIRGDDVLVHILLPLLVRETDAHSKEKSA